MFLILYNPRMSNSKKCSSLLRYFFYRIGIFLINLIPLNLALGAADRLGRTVLSFNKRRIAMTRHNLKQAFRDGKSDREIDRIIDDVNGSLFQVAVEFLRIPQLTKSVPMRNPERIWDALKAGKGAILLVSHLGNWELSAIGGGAEGLPIHAVGKPSNNPHIDEYIQEIRGKTGLQTIDKLGSVKDVSRLLKENQVICLTIDQRVKDGEPVDFLGQTAYLSSFPALLALRYGTPVIPCFIHRTPGPRYFVQTELPIPLVRGKNLRDTLHLNTQKFAKCVEAEILKDPGDWILWRHNIWKD